MIKAAVDLIKDSRNKKFVIIFDTDGDGISAAAIISKTFKRVFNKIPEAMPINHEFLFITKDMYKEIERKKFDIVITVDVAVDENPEYILKLAKNSKVLIIDHHQIHRNLNKYKNIVHLNPGLWKIKIPSYKYCTSKIVYDICNELTNIEDLDWMAGIGIVNDKCEDKWENFLNRVYKKYNLSHSKLKLINDIISSGYYYTKNKNLRIGYKTLLEVSLPKDILETKTANSKKLKRFYDKIEKEIVLTIKNWEKNAEIFEDKKLIILKLNTIFYINSPISTIISTEKPHYTVIVAKKKGKMTSISLRRQEWKN